MKLDDLLELTDKWALRIKELNPGRYIDTEQIADNVDSFLYWAYEELHPKEVVKRHSKNNNQYVIKH